MSDLILQFRNKIIFEKTIKNPLQKGFHCYIILLLRSMRRFGIAQKPRREGQNGLKREIAGGHAG